MNEQEPGPATNAPHIDMQRVIAFRHDADIWGDYINLNVLGLQGAPDVRQIAYRGVLAFVPLNRDPAAYPSNPDTGIRLGLDAATELMDRLWSLGIRPRNIGTPGHLAAVQAHLDDFRKIVGKLQGIDFDKPSSNP